jgi:glycosyltransferase involved in cell wall biosynthesis
MTAASELQARPVSVSTRTEARLRRVLYAIDLDASRKFGSLEEQVVTLARAFAERGGLFLPLFLRPPGPRGRVPYEEAGLPVAALDLRGFRPSNLVRLLRLVRAHRIDVIHWNFYPPLTNGYLWALTLLAPRVEHYLTDHNSRLVPLPAGGRFRPLKRVLLRRYSRVVGVSRFVVDCLRRQGTWPGVDCRPHFINTDRFRPDETARAEVRGRLGAAGQFVLLTVTHLIPEKGVDVAVRSLRDLPPHVVLWVVGDGPESRRLAELSGELGVRERVHFLGLQNEVEPYMQAADAFVCPSVWAEAAGLVCVEAQGCGLPVVASDTGGIPEYVADGDTGLLFRPGDAAGLAERVRRLLDDPEARGRMGRRARDRAVEQFSAAARLQEYLDLYRHTP